MLKQRILTAAVLIPLVLWAIYRLPAMGFIIITLLLMIAAAWEWARLSGLKSIYARIGYCVAIPVLFAATVLLSFWLAEPRIIDTFIYLASAWWLIAGGLLYRQNKQPSGTFSYPWRLSTLGFFILLSTWLSLNVLRIGLGPDKFLFFLVLIWGADIGAYFAGRYYGKRKLAINISPNKTWEGVIGALLCTAIIVYAFAFALSFSALQSIYFLILALLTVSFSIVGDLFESLLKRAQGLKDSGNVLPGHGGILDRIDSILAAAPIFVTGCLCQNSIMHYIESIL